MEQEKKHGGKREGAGRKKTTVKTYGFNAPQNIVQILERVKNKTDYINEAIEFYYNNKDKGVAK